ncbi:hypothetical protein [Promineifilum sp.]|uniref:hypothetical protein n=1 Tax=Promineifilum sp. TaxID=2664178 RepID=UPI0035B478C1
MSDPRVKQAARNNALWCDAVCRAHGRPGEFHAGLWLNRRPTPRFYSNAITLSSKDRAGQRAWIALLLAERPSFSVKDSFAALDLSGLGFDVLFEATWLWWDGGRNGDESPDYEPKQSAQSAKSADDSALNWSTVGDAAGLARWEAAWAGHHTGAVPDRERIFRPALLREPGVAFLAGARGGAVVAVAAANLTGDVVGLSNVFAPPDEADAAYAGAAALAAALFPGRPLVGYERGDDLGHARRAGFTEIGPLRVWAR